jgi:hypothetical protein
MLRKIFTGLGAIFAALIVFCASFVGNLAANIDRHGVDYETLAVDSTRDLSRHWKLADVEARYADAANDGNGLIPQEALDFLKPLGVLLYADDLTHKTLWKYSSSSKTHSPAVAAERLANLLSKAVKVTFVGKFAHGFANVTVELRSEGGRMKLWRLQIDSREKLRPPQELKQVLISHA